MAKYRAFTFNQFMLSSVQQGLQSTHSLMELALSNREREADDPTDARADMFWSWARDEKTLVVLNGGDCVDLQDLVQFLALSDNPYPWDVFREDASLNNALTSVAVILPEKFWSEHEKYLPLPIGTYVQNFNAWSADPNQTPLLERPSDFTMWEFVMLVRRASARRAV
jgi:hypothetical protein